jgi:hypothetical protein
MAFVQDPVKPDEVDERMAAFLHLGGLQVNAIVSAGHALSRVFWSTSSRAQLPAVLAAEPTPTC